MKKTWVDINSYKLRIEKAASPRKARARVHVSGSTIRGEDIDFPECLYTDESGYIDPYVIAEKIAKRNKLKVITVLPSDRDESSSEIHREFIVELGRPVSSGGYSHESKIRFKFN